MTLPHTAGARSTWAESSRSMLLDTARNLLDARRHRPADEDAALTQLIRKFGLDEFEANVVTTLAGVEAFADVAAWFDTHIGQSHPTISWCLDHFDGADGAGWQAFLPDSTLRRAQLIRLGPSTTVAASALRVDEDLVHHLLGHATLASRIDSLTVPVQLIVAGDDGSEASRRLVAAATDLADRFDAGDLFVAIADSTPTEAFQIAAMAGAVRGWGASMIDARTLADDPRQVDELANLWNREAILHDLVLVVDLTQLSPVEPTWNVAHFLHRVRSPLVTAGRLPSPLHRPVTTVHIPIGNLRHRLGTSIEQRSASDALAERTQRLARRVSLDDVVLPPASKTQLNRLAARVVHATQVYEQWDFASLSRSSGVSALFAGPSGTGKTMAAEALASELGLDLYRVDLAATVSKYIGETEQNLAQIFDAAEQCNAMLLFDEADALFGKRTEVRDSHDRYANIEVSYLLQRIEGYTGVAILTSNIKSALDHAFARRLSVVVDFPLPGAVERAEIWRRSLPAAAPTDSLDPERLAGLSVAGGSIQNMALAAAFTAASAHDEIRYHHVLEAARAEYAKLGRQLTDAETRGWT